MPDNFTIDQVHSCACELHKCVLNKRFFFQTAFWFWLHTYFNEKFHVDLIGDVGRN